MRLLSVFAVAAAGPVAALLAGCTPQIGNSCQLNTDCSLDGTRVCDNSQPNGYCTTFNCTPGSCLDNAVCVMTYASIPGCTYSDYAAPGRQQRTLCLHPCQQDSDCRTGDGYVCRSPQGAPYYAIIIDSNTSQKVCVAAPLSSSSSAAVRDSGTDGEPPVCMPYGPSVPPLEESGAPAPPDGAATDAPADTGDAQGGG